MTIRRLILMGAALAALLAPGMAPAAPRVTLDLNGVPVSAHDPLPADITGSLRSSTATDSNVGSSATSVTLLAANTLRKGDAFTNDSTAILYVDCSGGTASTSHYSKQLAAGEYWEGCPFGYSGAITGIWASANGNARVTEFQ